MPISISIIVIAKQINKPLQDYLQKMEALCERVLLMDTSDKHPISDFAAIRNSALKKAKTNWVLFLDSDERITPTDFIKLKKKITHSQASGLYLRRSDIFYGKQLKYGEWGNTKVLRAMKRSDAIYTGIVHEVPNITGIVEDTNITIAHFAHPTISQFVAKVSYYASLAASEKKSNLNKISLEIITYPLAKFLLNYCVRLGFRDGWRGLAYSTIMSLHSFFVRAYSIERYLKNENFTTR